VEHSKPVNLNFGPLISWNFGLVQVARTDTGRGLTLQPPRKSPWHWSASHRGNQSSIKGIGEGVAECRIDFGPGYRIYLGKDGQQLIILLGGGTKKRQDEDIESAKSAWREYKKWKKTSQQVSAKALATSKTKTKSKQKPRRKQEE
jgi:putative addiction module killer protein